MLAFFIWSCIYTVPIKLSGTATIESGQATLVLDDLQQQDKEKMTPGTKIYILDKEGVLSFDGERPIVTNIDLSDGRYIYRTDIVIREAHPINYLLKR